MKMANAIEKVVKGVDISKLIPNEKFNDKEQAEARAEYLRIGTFKNTRVVPAENGKYLVVKEK